MVDCQKEEVINLKGDVMDRTYCIKCSSHYMNGDDEWCNHYDKCCEHCPNDCDYFEEWNY